MNTGWQRKNGSLNMWLYSKIGALNQNLFKTRIVPYIYRNDNIQYLFQILVLFFSNRRSLILKSGTDFTNLISNDFDTLHMPVFPSFFADFFGFISRDDAKILMKWKKITFLRTFVKEFMKILVPINFQPITIIGSILL